GLTVNVGLEGWFSERVRNVVGASLAAAEAYEEDHRRDLSEDAQTLANILNSRRKSSFLMTDGDLRALLGQAQEAIQRGLKEAYVIDGTGQIRARGARSYLFDFEAPDAEALIAAQSGDVVIIEDWDNNEYRALVSLSAFVDRFLYVSRSVDGDILALLDETQETVHLYQQLEAERGRMLFEFALLYLGFAVILILAAIWLGLWFAERLSRPVGRLAGAAQRVGAGDLSVRVREEQGDDEIAMLGRIFNQMTRQLEVQRRNLLESNHRSEAQRRLMDNVLASVTAGVFGLDDQGRVEFINRSGRRMLAMDGFQPIQQPLAAVVPEFAPLLEELRLGKSEIAQQEIQLRRLSLHATMLV
ncbi:MAG: HAMP domain-containing protein, partial [Mangrovicoccus sp.]